MATRAFVLIPEGGLTVRGMKFPAGPRRISDDNWYRTLRAVPGVQEITENDYLVATQQQGDAEAKKRRAKKK